MKFQQHNLDSDIESSQTEDYEEVNDEMDDKLSYSQQFIPSEIE